MVRCSWDAKPRFSRALIPCCFSMIPASRLVATSCHRTVPRRQSPTEARVSTRVVVERTTEASQALPLSMTTRMFFR